jgi:hypothetical protein|nr:MAG TPA: Protein of unknown function (DUF1642) [Caudoviricetes sp.]
MNKQDLKEGQEVYVKGQVIHTGDHLDIVLAKGSFIENAIILHHEKPVVPQFVADLIEYAKDHDWDLEDTFQNIAGEADDSNIYQWYYTKSENMDTFARAWLDGYEVEKEKRYLVKVKNVLKRQSALNRNKKSGRFIFSNPEENSLYDTKFTRKELEEAGFGWVFDCPGIEIEEAE